ncbi:DUF3221 domain-containing protein [Halalkalibacter oceani]|uniref:DUF3221 domain-containing protein n=1 Tax=Halalkalibacter oceani TaxID=1653776 RepID=UPI003396F658
MKSLLVFITVSVILVSCANSAPPSDGHDMVGNIVDIQDNTLIVQIQEVPYQTSPYRTNIGSEIRFGIPDSNLIEQYSVGQTISIWTEGILDSAPATSQATRIEFP